MSRGVIETLRRCVLEIQDERPSVSSDIADARIIVAGMLVALRECENALADYVPQLERAGGMMGYGRRVLELARASLREAAGEQP